MCIIGEKRWIWYFSRASSNDHVLRECTVMSELKSYKVPCYQVKIGIQEGVSEMAIVPAENLYTEDEAVIQRLQGFSKKE